MPPTMIVPPREQKWLANQECATTHQTYLQARLWSCPLGTSICAQSCRKEDHWVGQAGLCCLSLLAQLHGQLKKNVANDPSKGNSEMYPADIHKALTLMNEYMPLKLDAIAIPAQVTAFVTKSYGKGKKGASKKYYNDAEWKALSSEAQVKIINGCKNIMSDDSNDDKSVASAKSAKTKKAITKIMKSLEKDNHRLKNSVSALQVRCRWGQWLVHIICWGVQPFPRSNRDAARISPKDCVGSEVKQVHWVGPQKCSPVGQSTYFWFVLQHEVCLKGHTCFRWWSEEHRAMQDICPIPITNIIPQESYQDLQGHIWQQSGQYFCCPSQCVWFTWLDF